MKTELKRIISIALTLSLIWGLVGGIAPVKSFADPDPDTYSFTIRIVWNDYNNVKLLRPDSLVAYFAGIDITLNEDNNWTGSVQAESDNGSWVLDNIPDLYYSSSQVEDSTTTITLSHDPVCEHEKEEHAAVSPTCTTPGNSAYWYCPTCNAYFSHPGGVFSYCAIEENSWIIPASHDYALTKDADHHWRECRVCHSIDPDNPKTAHTYSNGHCLVCDAVQPASSPESENMVESPSTPPGGNINQEDTTPPEPEDPFAVKTKEVNDELDSILKLLSTLAGGTAVSLKYPQGIIFDMGSCLSFKKATYEKIDKVLSSGFPVTIKYIYKGRNCTLIFPANCGAKLASYCDVDGYIGFENLKGKLIAGQYISASQSDILALLYVSNAANTAASISEVKSADNGVITLSN